MSAQPTPARRHRRARRGTHGRIAGCVAALVVTAGVAPAVAVDVGAVARKSQLQSGLGEAAQGRGFMVTFADRPGAAEARSRLAGLGRVDALAPEAGVWRVTPSDDVWSIQAARGRPRVESAEWPLVRRAAERPIPADPLPLVDPGPFTDPLQPQQWALSASGWTPNLTGRQPRPTIAILDGGIDRDHPEWSGPDSPLTAGFTAFPGQSDSNSDDWGETGHGTHVAGIAAAPANGIGIVGVAPGNSTTARVMPVQVADRFGDFSDDDLIAGIRFAVSNGAKVINISAGGPGAVDAFQRTIYWATQKGVVIVAAVGNEGDGVNTLNYPAAYRRVIGVAAQCGSNTNALCPTAFGVARYSNHNATVDITAPGDGIVSTVPAGVDRDIVSPGYGLKDGTSMASPFVAGTVALMQASNNNALTPFQVMRHLEATAADIGPRGRDDVAGYGVMNLRRAVTERVPPDDTGEVNDEITNVRGRTPPVLPVGGPPRIVEADIDQFDDPDDVYPVKVRGGARIRIELSARGGRQSVYLWGPATRTVSTGETNLRRNLLGYRGGNGTRQVLVVRVPKTARYYVDVYGRQGQSTYRLALRALR